MIKDLILRDLYYSPKTGYRSIEHLYQLAKHEDNTITRGYVKKWMQRQNTYTKYKKYNNPKHYRKTFVRDLGEQVQIDLVTFMSKHDSENDGYKYIMMCIELLSRYAIAIPLRKKEGRVLKVTMEEFLQKFKDRFNAYPKLMQFDEGPEFLNKNVIDLLKSHNIVFFSTSSDRKASIVERLNRTIKEKILKMFNRNGNHDWLSYLNDVVENYNAQENRAIGTRPIDVNETNKYTIWGRLYGHVIHVDRPKFSVGDKVRVLHFNPKGKGKEFKRYYKEKYPKRISKITGRPISEHMVTARDKPPFSEETFTVHVVLLGDPVMYKLYSPEAEIEILGKYYESELSLVR